MSTIDTLDQLIAALQTLRAAHGGDAPIAIDDADTSWHMRIERVRESRTVPGRILIEGAGYHRDDSTLPS